MACGTGKSRNSLLSQRRKENLQFFVPPARPSAASSVIVRGCPLLGSSSLTIITRVTGCCGRKGGCQKLNIRQAPNCMLR